jgi:hypothetical protein
MKYDDASWHYNGDFPADLPMEAGATHTGTYVAWALFSGLFGEPSDSVFADEFPELEGRTVTPGAFFLSAFDGKFTDDELTKQGKAFTKAYFDVEKGKFLADYEATLGEGLPEDASLYYVADSWENFDKLRPVLDRRFAEWRDKATKA